MGLQYNDEKLLREVTWMTEEKRVCYGASTMMQTTALHILNLIEIRKNLIIAK